MKRTQIAPDVFVNELAGDKFKRSRIAINLVTPSSCGSATALAMLPYVLQRRCAAIPDALKLSRLLSSLYGAQLSCDSYTSGARRIISIAINGLKDEYDLDGGDLSAKYADLLCNIVFAPKLDDGVFEHNDVAIEREKWADTLRGEVNDKSGYCLRQARGKLYGSSPLGIESTGYLEDVEGITSETLYGYYAELLRDAVVEVVVCGANAEKVGARISEYIANQDRSPVPQTKYPVLGRSATFERYTEAQNTVQGKLAIILTSGVQPNGRIDAVSRVASYIYGGMSTSRLFRNVRERASLCYYCSSSYDFFGGTLTVESGVDHANARRAADMILSEFAAMQNENVTMEELKAAKLAMRVNFSAMKDRPTQLMNWSVTECLKGTYRTPGEMCDLVDTVTVAEVREALAAFTPAVEYVITDKKGDA